MTATTATSSTDSPFSIFYRFNDAEVVFVAVAHHKRKPGYWARRR